MHISQTVIPCNMSPEFSRMPENNSGVFNYFVKVYEEGKKHVCTFAVSASLFVVLKCLETSRSLETATRDLETATSNSVLLSDLEQKITFIAWKNAVFTTLKGVNILLSVSKQLEMYSGEIEGNTYNPGIKLHEVFHKNAVLSKHWGLIKLSQISRHLELLTDDLEVLTHEIANNSFQLQQPHTFHVLAIGDRILGKINGSDAHFNQIKNRLYLQAIGRLMHLSKESEKLTVYLASSTGTKCAATETEESKSARLEQWFLNYIQTSGIKYALLLSTQRSVLKLFELSRAMENVTKELELSVHTAVDPSFKSDSDPYLNSLIAKTVAYVQYQIRLTQINVYSTTLSALFGFINALHQTSEQLDNVSTALMTNVTYRGQNALKFISEIKKKINYKSLAYPFTLPGITMLLYISRALEKTTGGREIPNYKTATIRKAAISQILWFVLQAKNISRSLETVTRTAEASTAPGFEKKIKNSVIIAIVTAGISIITRLENAAKLLQKPIINLETALQNKIVCRGINKKSKRDKNCNDEDGEFASVGRSYKMMNASKELERLLNELEAFIIDLPDVQETKPEKQEVVETVSILRTILLKAALIGALTLFKTSKSLEQATGSIERFEVTDLCEFTWKLFERTKMEFYQRILLVALWNVNKFTETSRLVQPAISDLELFAHENCYPSVHRKEISFCSRALNKTAKAIYELQDSLQQKQRRISLSVSNLLQDSKTLFVNAKFILIETYEQIFNVVPKALYPKCIKFSLNVLQTLLVLTEKMKEIAIDFEQKQEQLPHSRLQTANGVYDYGRDAIIVWSKWCTNELAEFMQSCISNCEKIRIFEFWNKIDRFNMEFAKNLQCRLINPHFTFEFQLQITSSVNCYKTNSETICST